MYVYTYTDTQTITQARFGPYIPSGWSPLCQVPMPQALERLERLENLSSQVQKTPNSGVVGLMVGGLQVDS